MSVEIRRFESPRELAISVADALVLELERLQREEHLPRVVLTGGRIAADVHRAVAQEPGIVNWEKIDIWFSDERFVPRRHEDRNFKQIHDALFGTMQFDYNRLHEMPAPRDDFHDDAIKAASEFGADLLSRMRDVGPWFDITMLSIGPDGHCAALFPGHPEMYSPDPVVAVLNAPKQPSTRITLGLDTLCNSAEVWLLASGLEKADAVAAVLADSDVKDVPAAGSRGQVRTILFVDEDAASKIPETFQ